MHVLYILSDFPSIRNLSSFNDLKSLSGLSGLNDLESLISSKKNLLNLNPGSKMTYPGVAKCGRDHQKSPILLIFGTFFIGGCGGHPLRPKINLKYKGQMSKPNEYTDNFKSNLTCIFLSKFKKQTFCPRTLCSLFDFYNFVKRHTYFN